MKYIYWGLAFILLLTFAECALVGYIGYWREFFWEAVQQKNLHNFLVLMAKFTGVALLICLINGYASYLVSYLSLVIRSGLTEVALRLSTFKDIEGGEQRVQEDCMNYPLLGLQLLVGFVRNLLILVIFSVIVITQVGVTYLLIPIAYTIVGTVIAWIIAKPLIKLNYSIQVIEAAFRRVVLNSLTGGIVPVYTTFMKVFDTNKEMYITTKKLSYFQNFYNQITAIVPYVIIFPLYFSGKMIFGIFMQVASSINHVIDSLSYIINSFNQINNWLSCRKRLKEIGVVE